MLKVFQEVDKKILAKAYESSSELNSLETGSWVHLSNPTLEDLKKINELTNISLDFLNCALDEEESARVDKDDGDSLIVLDTPLMLDEEKANYTTVPFIIAYNKNYYVTICKHDVALISEVFRKVKLVEPHKHVRLTLYLIYRLATLFITYLKKINAHTEALEIKLRTSVKNKEVLELMDKNKALVYFSTALNADKGVLSKLLRSQTYKRFEDDFDLMEDAEVEMDQAIEMCSIYRNILSGMMDAFASVINNNMNTVMKTLSVITIVISLPTLIASIYGMNLEYLPLDDNKYGFWIILCICAIFAIIGAIVLFFIGSGIRHRRK